MNLTSLIKKGTLRGFATATPATPATDGVQGLRTVATVATVAVATPQGPAANDVQAVPSRARAFIPIDADRGAWPHGPAMNGREIDTFTARLAHFSHRGLPLDAGEHLADRLVIRDREDDDRRVCLECLHLHHGGGWHCGQRQRAGLAIGARDAQLATEFVNLLQRCDGFADAIQIHQKGDEHGQA